MQPVLKGNQVTNVNCLPVFPPPPPLFFNFHSQWNVWGSNPCSLTPVLPVWHWNHHRPPSHSVTVSVNVCSIKQPFNMEAQRLTQQPHTSHSVQNHKLKNNSMRAKTQSHGRGGEFIKVLQCTMCSVSVICMSSINSPAANDTATIQLTSCVIILGDRDCVYRKMGQK